MIEFGSLGELAQHLLKQSAEDLHAAHKGIDRATAILQREAKAEFGVYQDAAGPFPAWEELAESTKADRVAKGFSEDEPLLRTGDLRDSIEREVGEWEGIVGSTSEIMPFHEFGTVKMPARPVLGTALYRNADKIAKIIGNAFVGNYASTARVGYDEDGNYAALDFGEGTEVHSSLGYDA